MAGNSDLRSRLTQAEKVADEAWAAWQAALPEFKAPYLQRYNHLHRRVQSLWEEVDSIGAANSPLQYLISHVKKDWRAMCAFWWC